MIGRLCTKVSKVLALLSVRTTLYAATFFPLSEPKNDIQSVKDNDTAWINILGEAFSGTGGAPGSAV